MTIHNKYFFLVLIALFSSIRSLACSCDDEGTVNGNLKYSEAVFSGTVIGKYYTANYDSLNVVYEGDTSKIIEQLKYYPTWVVSIKVDKLYKGRITSDTITILTPIQSSACGYRFDKGQKYIVYSTIYDGLIMSSSYNRRSTNQNTFWTHHCTRTRTWQQSEENEILKELKK